MTTCPLPPCPWCGDPANISGVMYRVPNGGEMRKLCPECSAEAKLIRASVGISPVRPR